MSPTQADKQDRIIELLSEILKWTKVTSIPEVKTLLLETLPSNEEKVAYNYSNGDSSQDIAKLAGVSYTTITRWWKTWIRVGIAESINVRGGDRARKTFSLEDFGIQIKVPNQGSIPKEKSVADIPRPNNKRQDGEIH